MEVTEIDLKAFCGTGKEWRYALGEPFVRGGFKYATDTQVCVRVPTDEPDTPTGEKRFPNVMSFSLWGQFPLEQPSDFLVPHLPPLVTYECYECAGLDYECPECEGHGDVEWYGDYTDHTYSATCQMCDGEGAINEHGAVRHGVSRKAETVECGACNGSKRLTKEEKVTLFGLTFDAKYVRLIAVLPGVRAKPASFFKGDLDCLLFEADGGVQGVVMAMLTG